MIGALGRPQPRLPRLGRREQVWLRVVLAVGLVALVYRVSLGSLVDNFSLQTPLAYLGIVPVLALGMMLVRGRPAPGEASIEDRDVDWILTGVLILVAGEIML